MASNTLTEEQWKVLKEGKDVKEETLKVFALSIISASQPSAEHLELVGDLCRQDQPRDVLGSQDGFIARVVSYLGKDADANVNKFAARALGNLCFNHDDNRVRVLSANGIDKLVTLLKSDAAPVVAMSAGTLSNLSYASDTVRSAVVQAGVVEAYLQLLAHEDETVKQRAIHGLTNLADDPDAVKNVADEHTLHVLTKLFQGATFDEELLKQCISLLSTLLETEVGTEVILKSKFAQVLLAHLERKDSPVRKEVEQFFAELIDDDKRRNRFEYLVKPCFENRNHPDEVVRHASLRILSALCLEDAYLDLIYPQYAEILKILDTSKEIKELLPCTMLLGNMLRSDERCEELMKNHFLEKLIPLLDHEDARLPHLVLGAIRNICVGDRYKKLVVEKVGWKPFLTALESQNAHVIYGAIACFRLLVNAGEEFREGMVQAGAIEALAKIDGRTLMDGQERVRYEAARVIGALAREEKYRDRVVQAQGIPILVKLLEPNFEITRVEGLSALANLATSSDDAKRAIVEAGVKDRLKAFRAGGEKRENVLKAISALELILGQVVIEEIKVEKPVETTEKNLD